VVATLNAIWTGLLAVGIVTVGRGGVAQVAVAQLVVALLLLILHVAVARRLAGLGIAAFVTDLLRPALAVVIAVMVTGLLRGVGGPRFQGGSWVALGLLAVVFVATHMVGAVVLDRRLLVDLRRLIRSRDSRRADASPILVPEDEPGPPALTRRHMGLRSGGEGP
jgi:hypothetical protein